MSTSRFHRLDSFAFESDSPGKRLARTGRRHAMLMLAGGTIAARR